MRNEERTKARNADALPVVLRHGAERPCPLPGGESFAFVALRAVPHVRGINKFDDFE